MKIHILGYDGINVIEMDENSTIKDVKNQICYKICSELNLQLYKYSQLHLYFNHSNKESQNNDTIYDDASYLLFIDEIEKEIHIITYIDITNYFEDNIYDYSDHTIQKVDQKRLNAGLRKDMNDEAKYYFDIDSFPVNKLIHYNNMIDILYNSYSDSSSDEDDTNIAYKELCKLFNLVYSGINDIKELDDDIIQKYKSFIKDFVS